MIYNKIENIKLEFKPFKKEDLISLSYTNSKYSTDIILSVEKEIKIKNLSIQINFNEDIFKWRDHDYKWIQTNNEILVANDFVNKCIFFNDGVKVIPSKNIGLWKYNPKNKKQLIWVLEDKFLTPVIQFDKKDNKELIDSFIIQETVNLKLLFTDKKTPEFSRSKVPFSSILCFTDHCDFDSLLLLEKQRNLFKKLDIKITKGFFLNHFSKRDYNVSIEREKKHLLSWVKDGHELCYHSLTQSIRNIEEATLEFDNFSAPVQKVSTWIDHGFQPYNLTMLNRKKKNIIYWIKKQNNRNIYNFWTYNDCGSGGVGIINQLNSKQFTPKRLIKSLKKKSLKVKIFTFIRSYIFHFSDDNKAVFRYKKIAKTVKNIIYKKEIGKVFSLIFDGFYLFFHFLKVSLKWRIIKNKPSKYAKYSPILFKNKALSKESIFFQTIEINDFVETFSNENIESFINESGICIAHTYFSVLFEYHKGRLFINELGDYNPNALSAFKLISKKVKENKIWNPTLASFIEYYLNYKKIDLDIDLNGEILFLHHEKEVKFRFI